MLRTRSDTYPVYNNRTRVVARPNHTFYPEQRISATYKVQLRFDDEKITTEEEEYLDEDFGVIKPKMGFGHHRSDEATVVTHGSLLNFVLPDTILKPQTSNIAEVFPKSQMYLMPYLCERKNIEAKMGEMFEREHYQLKAAYTDTDWYRTVDNHSHEFFEETYADGSEFVYEDGGLSGHQRVNQNLMYDPTQFSMYHIRTRNVLGDYAVRNLIAQGAALRKIDASADGPGDGIVEASRRPSNPNAVKTCLLLNGVEQYQLPLVYKGVGVDGFENNIPTYSVDLDDFLFRIDDREFGHEIPEDEYLLADGNRIQATRVGSGDGVEDARGGRVFVIKTAEADDNDEHVLHFKFEEGSKIEVVWGEDGYGITKNASPNNPDYDQSDDLYMYFRIWTLKNEMADPTIDADAAQNVINGLQIVGGDYSVTQTACTQQKQL